MASALLGRDQENAFRSFNNKEPNEKNGKITKWFRNALLSLLAVLSIASFSIGGTAKAGIWDLGDQVVAAVMNICNPNEVPITMDTTSWVDSVMGSAGPRPVANREAEPDGNIWSTYNPMVDHVKENYLVGTNPKDLTHTKYLDDSRLVKDSTSAWTNLLKAKDGENYLYHDIFSDRGSVKDNPSGEWFNLYKGEGDRDMFPMDPSNPNAAYYNAPTVALQDSYQDAPPYVIHPTYTRYGFESLKWTSYGASCYAPERFINIVPTSLFNGLVIMPTLLTFGLLRLTLGGELAHVFYMFVYPITSLIGQYFSPWAALIAIVIGLPFVWFKSRGSIQKLLSGATWIAAMLFAITQLTNHAQAFTEFSQGLVVKVSGAMACTIANQAFTDGTTTIYLGQGEIEGYQKVPKYDDTGNVQRDANGNVEWTDVASNQSALATQARDNAADGTVGTLTLEDLKGVGNNDVTSCGSYLDGIYNAYWLGVPLQVWAEGQVGSAQAARDRVAESNGKIGWYQATLNAMYVNPRDNVGKAQLEATARWNDAGYTANVDGNFSEIGKPGQWSMDGKADGEPWDIPVNNMDESKTATPWKTIPFLLNVKYLCKDDQVGTIDDDNAGDYAGNKWLYDGTCITSASEGTLDGLRGYNVMDRLGLVVVGGLLALILFLFTGAICIYIGYQKFIWGFMLLFAPIFLGIAAFPDEKRRDFFRKYVEFCVSNVIKQIVAVIILVVTVTALGRIVFPNQMSIGDFSLSIPWMLKPFIAIMFLLAAILFALPMKRIMTGAVKGDSSVVKKTAETGGDVAKAAGAAAAVAGAVALTGGTAALAGAGMKSAGRMAQMAAMRKGGMTGALAHAAGESMQKKGMSMEQAANDRAAAAGIAGGNDLLSGLKRDKALKKATGTAGLSEKAALAANAKAAKAGEDLPYAVDENGNLTKAGLAKAKKDYVGMRKGQFAKSPEFTSQVRKQALQDQRLAAAKDSLRSAFTDANGIVDEAGLEKAALASVAAENANSLSRREKLGNALLAEDKKKPLDERKYLDAKGNLDEAGTKKLLSDIAALDNFQVAQANGALAHELMNADPDKYNALSTKDDPNGGFRAALADANRMNFGKDGLVGSDINALGSNIEGMKGTEAYRSKKAPVIGRDLSAGEAAVLVEHMGQDMSNLPDGASEALADYAKTLSASDVTPEEIQKSHADTLAALYDSKGLTDASRVVNDEVLSPLEKGMSLTPAGIREVASGLPSSSVALKHSLANYADAVEDFGSDSMEARNALGSVSLAANHEDKSVYASAVGTMPRPESLYSGEASSPAALAAGAAAAGVAGGKVVNPSLESANYREAMRSYYGLAENSQLSGNDVFTPAELQDIESGKIAPQGLPDGRVGLASQVGLSSAGALSEAKAAVDSNVLAQNPAALRDAKRAELGLSPDDAPLTAPLLSVEEASSLKEAQNNAELASATGLSSAPVPVMNVEKASADYVAQMRSEYGLDSNPQLQAAGVAFTEGEMKQIDNGQVKLAAVSNFESIKSEIPATPEAVREAKRAELGLAPDNNKGTAPLMSAQEQRAVEQMQSAGVVLGASTVAANNDYNTMPVHQVEGLTSATGGRRVEGTAPLTPAAEVAFAQAVDNRADGSKYVNGMVLNPASSVDDLNVAVSSLPETHPAREAMVTYSNAVESRVENPAAVVEARDAVLGSLGMATVASAPEVRQKAVEEAQVAYTEVLRNPEATSDQIRSAERTLYSAAAPVVETRSVAGVQSEPLTLTDSGQERMTQIMEEARVYGIPDNVVAEIPNRYATDGMRGVEAIAYSSEVPQDVVNAWSVNPPQVVQPVAPAPLSGTLGGEISGLETRPEPSRDHYSGEANRVDMRVPDARDLRSESARQVSEPRDRYVDDSYAPAPRDDYRGYSVNDRAYRESDAYRYREERGAMSYPAPSYRDERMALEDEIGARIIEDRMLNERSDAESAERRARLAREINDLSSRVSSDGDIDRSRIEREYIERNIPEYERYESEYHQTGGPGDESRAGIAGGILGHLGIMRSRWLEMNNDKREETSSDRQVRSNGSSAARREEQIDYDDPAVYERHSSVNSSDVNQMKKNAEGMLKKLKKLKSSISQLEGLKKRRLGELSRLKTGSAAWEAKETDIKGITARIDQKVREYNELAEKVNRLNNNIDKS